MADLNEVTAKVQRILANNWRVELTASGSFLVRLESTVCRISCFQNPDEGDDDPVFISVRAPILRDVPVTDDLFKWIATEGTDYRFGKAHLYYEEGETTGQLYFSHTLLGDYLDAEELSQSLTAGMYYVWI